MWRSLAYFAVVAAAAALAFASSLALPDDPSTEFLSPRARPIRLASLSPSTTELCAALDLVPQLVARSSFCEYPPEVQRIPDVGGLLDPNLERLLSLRPDLVLLPGKSLMLREAIGPTGLPFAALPDSTLDDVFVSLRELGRLTGRGDHAERVVRRIHADLESLSQQVDSANVLRVLLVISPSRIPPVNPQVAGPGSYLDILLGKTGHVNAMADLGRGWAEVGLETLVRANPDVIVEFWPNADPQALATARQAWGMVGLMNAVRDGRIHVISGGVHWIPGPRVTETLRALVEVLKE